MTTRETKAIEALVAGGYFREALERNFRGHEKFTTRLLAGFRSTVKGIGYATRRDFEDAGIIVRRECFVGSCWAKEWEIDPTVAALFKM